MTCCVSDRTWWSQHSARRVDCSDITVAQWGTPTASEIAVEAVLARSKAAATLRQPCSTDAPTFGVSTDTIAVLLHAKA